MFPTLAEIESTLAEGTGADTRPLRVTVLRNVMVETLEPYLRYLGLKAGLDLGVRFGEFDNIIQDAVSEDSPAFETPPDVVLVFSRLEGLSWNLARNFPSLSTAQIEEEVTRLEDFFEATLSGIRARSNAMILWFGFEPPCSPAMGVLDAQSSSGQKATVARLNATLRDRLAATTNAYLIDAETCLMRVGTNSFYDQRYWHIGRAPYTLAAMQEVARETFKFMRALTGKNKKCIVLDCDNTLWGGVIGEDGLAGIKVGKNYPGSPFYEFQQEILCLAHRGIILALCSKNNEADVWEVFDKHPDMLLKRKHIAAWRINWQDKATNIRELACELNIGLDSMVFIDDSDFEINLVRQELPEVECIHLQKGKTVEYREKLASCGLFDTLTSSAEDKSRGEMYHAERCRKEARTKATDLFSYYESLEMEIEIGLADSFTIPRIAQQTQKTNQFNLTTRRYNEADCQSLASADSSDVIWLRLQDRFGDSGVVGTCILRYEGDSAEIDTLLLSCRVLGRDVERVFMSRILSFACAKGMSRITGIYLKTQKNSQVEDFYLKQNFTELESERTDDRRVFVHDLDNYAPPAFDHFKSIVFKIQQ